MSFEGKSQQEPRNWQMDRILIILKKENGPRASSAPALGLNTIMFKHVYWYMQQTQVSVYRTIGPLVKTLPHFTCTFCPDTVKYYALVICNHCPPPPPPPHTHTYGEVLGIAGLKFGAITFQVSPQCRGNDRVLILGSLPQGDFL